MQHMTYEEELRMKTKRVKDVMERIGGLSVEVKDCVPSPKEYRYRNKAQLPVTPEGIGFYAPRSHRVTETADCLIAHLQKLCFNTLCLENETVFLHCLRDRILQTVPGHWLNMPQKK